MKGFHKKRDSFMGATTFALKPFVLKAYFEVDSGTGVSKQRLD